MKIWGLYSLTGLIFAAATLLVDQGQKVWTIAFFQSGETAKIVVAPFFDIVLVWNRGVSYGLFKQDSAAGQWILIAFAFAATLALFLWLAHMQTRLSAAAVGLIMGGALGNAIDRMQYGAVADFFSFHVGSFHWYVFNLADVAIVAGVGGLLYDSLKSSHKEAGNQA
ncbi:lipoprotein signal peptidase [Rhodomicrobium vannielii ATCC 17100]|uniref:Lipoprotein signal peptidase n=1 Tax=Rhodomicrobium vannielii (strain ATCC 17100 / DSM 162 / LMG 4299 / NCIMB 10020 / ATH 3.1.1) TaxID=648757 RepID=E3HYW4_RHOVT|nr:signal peptidase II [Rhodomicrobium vannielii]ADP70939.1 lipoprotein signal peptidase [Rhodomicrobium vannielii ATCC 17100]